jgi:hypothetical protein
VKKVIFLLRQIEDSLRYRRIFLTRFIQIFISVFAKYLHRCLDWVWWIEFTLLRHIFRRSLHPYRRTPLKLYLPFRFSNKSLMHFSSFRACNNWLASSALIIQHNNIWFRAQIKKPIVKEFSPVCPWSLTTNLLCVSEINLVLLQIPKVQKTRLYYILLWSLSLFLSVYDRQANENI